MIPEEGRNGIRPPTPGTLGAIAWTLFDDVGPQVTIKQALSLARPRGLNDNNIRTELCRWRKFHGVVM
jgi:hypothetical protein